MSRRRRKKPPVDDKLIYQMASMGVPLIDIAKYFGMSVEFLKKRYGYEIESGRIMANVTVANKLYETALGGHVSAMIFWLKSRAGWKETTGLEVNEIPNEEQAQRVKQLLDRFVNYYQQQKNVTNSTTEKEADNDGIASDKVVQ